MKSPDVRYLSEFLTDLAAAIESGRWFSVEKLSDGEPYTITLTGMPFRLGARYRIIYPLREVWQNKYPGSGSTDNIHASPALADELASSNRIECVHYREVIDREKTI